MVVEIAGSTCRLVVTRSFFSSDASLRPGSSRPTTDSSEALADNAATLHATLAAPPGRSSTLSILTTGTGASGEMRLTSPNQ
jgi:hypothetical protein